MQLHTIKRIKLDKTQKNRKEMEEEGERRKRTEEWSRLSNRKPYEAKKLRISNIPTSHKQTEWLIVINEQKKYIKGGNGGLKKW